MRSLLLIFFFCPVLSFAALISGDIVDGGTRMMMAHVHIVNIHTNHGVISDSNGQFSIAADKGQLLEFRKIGYKTLRIRIPKGAIPPYFKVIMQQGAVELPEYALAAKGKDWKKDSIRYYQLYKSAIEFPALEGLDVIRHPFSAMSKKNRQIWAFQKQYSFWQQQKYIDYTFNEKLVSGITGLSGDSLETYMRKFRPSYEALRAMKEYTFYTYIKETADFYKTGRRKYVPVIRRSAN